MRKLKIIEVGRILTEKELGQVRGGISCTSAYEGCNKHGDCLSGNRYLTCSQVSAAYGYETDGSTTTCGSGYTYGNCDGANSKQTCNSTMNYSTTVSGGDSSYPSTTRP